MRSRRVQRAAFLGLMLLAVHTAALAWMWLEVGPPKSLEYGTPVWGSILRLDAAGMYLYTGMVGSDLDAVGRMVGLLLGGGLQWLVAGMIVERSVRRFVVRPIAGSGDNPLTEEGRLQRESLRVRRTGRA